MPAKDPHGHAPDHAAVAVLLVDVINDLDFAGNRQMLRDLPHFTDSLLRLKQYARRHKWPVVYVNDNFGLWQSDFDRQVRYCSRPESAGRELAKALHPDPQDYFVLKPMHSGFYRTCLDSLLEGIRVKTLIIAGIAADRCVLFTASDGHLRGFKLIVPQDCVIANSQEDKRQALDLMKRVLEADVRSLASLTKTPPRKRRRKRRMAASQGGLFSYPKQTG